MSWPVAQNYCRETYGDLATVESDLDWILLKEILARESLTDAVWVGLYNDVSSWRWSFNGVSLKNTFTNWGTGQPNNFQGNESCGETGPVGVWWDFNCESLYTFICYNDEVREKQFMRLQVKSGSSMFGSDVQKAILELVKQKLGEYGMLESTTVTWRVQSDGQIFHKKKPYL
ncbi:L-selectin-like [Tachysurus fulvidraco]|uniref:L-selectin-like n=1 Tax=Tachysurus fulvidraco TaxID=1234273 RepID=UPI001FEFB5ED|nr:L-selectin-like [Tachysurus fulvidraco]